MKINQLSTSYKLHILLSIIYLLSPLLTFAQKKEEPVGFDAFFKEGMTKIEGVFPVYKENEKIYLEIPQKSIGREIEIRTQINRGFDMIARPMQSLGVVRLEMGQNHTICFQKGIFAERILDEKSELQQSFRASNKQPIDIVYPIIAYAKNREGYIIDITSILKEGKSWFRMTYNHVRALNSEYSKVTDIHPFERGVSFKIHQMYGYNPERENTAGTMIILPEGLMSAEIGCVIQLLPKRDMKLRLACSKIGFKTIGFWDFSQNPYGVVRDSIIMRWNLGIAEKDMSSYLKGKPVEPVHPIVFYIDSHLPGEYIPAVKEAATAWNKAFKRAGFKNAIQIKIADQHIRLEEQKAVIAYDLIEPGIKSSFTVHPRTGEILSCRINIGHGFLPRELTLYLLQCGAADSRIIENRSHKEIAHNIMTSALMKSIGEILGLKPNYAGSAAYTLTEIKDAKQVARRGYTASIMDENPYHYAASAEDRIATKNLVPCVGEYDCWAIGWAYKEFPKNKNCYADREALKSYLATSDTPAHRYSINGLDIRSGKGDLTQGRVEALNSGFENLMYIFENMEKIACKERVKDMGHALGSLTKEAMNMYGNYLNLTAECFGSSLPLKNQKEAMEILTRYFFSGATKIETEPVRKNHPVDIREMMVKNGKKVFEKIFSKELTEQLIEAEKEGRDGYTTTVFFKDLYQSLFADFDSETPFSFRQMDIQVLCIGTWLEVAEKNKIFEKQDMASIISENEMKYVYSQLKQLAETHIDSRSRNICKVLANRIAQKLTNKNKLL